MKFIIRNLRVKELRFRKCNITGRAAIAAMRLLKRKEHPFLLVHLFDSKSGYDAINLYEGQNYKKEISRVISLRCYHNKFQEHRNEFITEFREKGDRDQKLWYAGIMAAIMYDKEHDFLGLGDGGQPNMLYSLIREYPNNLKGV